LTTNEGQRGNGQKDRVTDSETALRPEGKNYRKGSPTTRSESASKCVFYWRGKRRGGGSKDLMTIWGKKKRRLGQVAKTHNDTFKKKNKRKGIHLRVLTIGNPNGRLEFSLAENTERGQEI